MALRPHSAGNPVSSLLTFPQAGRLGPALAAAALALAAALAASIWVGEGLFSPRGLLLFAGCVLAGTVAIAALAPELLAVAAPALMPLSNVWIFFPYEMAFYPLAFFVLLRALWSRPAWLTRLEDFE